MFIMNNKVPVTNCEPGVQRKVLTYTEEVMMCEISFEKGAKGNIHSHPHLQLSYVAEGRFEFMVNGERKVVEKGDCIQIPPESQHGTTALEAGKLIDVFVPYREDFV